MTRSVIACALGALRSGDVKRAETILSDALAPQSGTAIAFDAEREREGGVLLVAKVFNARIEATTGVLGTAQNAHRECDDIATWARGQARAEARPPLLVVEELVERFFRDAWAKEHRYPIRALAKDCGRYYVSTKARAEESRAELGARIEALHVRAGEAKDPAERSRLLNEAMLLASGSK